MGFCFGAALLDVDRRLGVIGAVWRDGVLVCFLVLSSVAVSGAACRRMFAQLLPTLAWDGALLFSVCAGAVSLCRLFVCAVGGAPGGSCDASDRHTFSRGDDEHTRREQQNPLCVVPLRAPAVAIPWFVDIRREGESCMFNASPFGAASRLAHPDCCGVANGGVDSKSHGVKSARLHVGRVLAQGRDGTQIDPRHGMLPKSLCLVTACVFSCGLDPSCWGSVLPVYPRDACNP